MEYITHIQDLVKNYDGKYASLIRLAPSFYKTINNILISSDAKGKTRQQLFVVLGYFIQPRDVMSEELLGAKGFLDDLFLCMHVFNKIIDNENENLLINHWEGDYEVLKNHLVETYIDIIANNKVMTQSVISYTEIDNI